MRGFYRFKADSSSWKRKGRVVLWVIRRSLNGMNLALNSGQWVNMWKPLIWRQKSRQTWCKLGDRNTKFFHLTATIRRGRNNITKILFDRVTHTTPHTIRLLLLLIFQVCSNSQVLQGHGLVQMGSANFLLHSLLSWNSQWQWMKLEELCWIVMAQRLLGWWIHIQLLQGGLVIDWRWVISCGVWICQNRKNAKGC